MAWYSFRPARSLRGWCLSLLHSYPEHLSGWRVSRTLALTVTSFELSSTSSEFCSPRRSTILRSILRQANSISNGIFPCGSKCHSQPSPMIDARWVCLDVMDIICGKSCDTSDVSFRRLRARMRRIRMQHICNESSSVLTDERLPCIRDMNKIRQLSC